MLTMLREIGLHQRSDGTFNTDAFKIPASFTPRLNPYQYEGINGPVFWNLDGTLSKTFPMKEKYKLEFRLEAYNLTNSLMWANPVTTIGTPNFSTRGGYSQ